MTTQSIPRLSLSNPTGSFWILALLFSACSGQAPVTTSAPPPASPGEVVQAEADPSTLTTPAPERVAPAVASTPPAAPSTSPAVASTRPAPLTWAQSTLARMTLREKVGQLMMPFVLGNFAPEGSETHDRIVNVIEEEHVGGVIMSVGSPSEVAVKLNDLQQHSKFPLLVAADLERGAGFRFRGAVHIPTNIALGGATTFPSLMAFGAAGELDYAYQLGRITALEARAMGVHVPFAPVLDVNNNHENPIINIRSFGEDPDAVAELGVALVRGIQDFGAVATGKHFPGHGDTETDSHLELPVIRVGRERLDAIELVPFPRGHRRRYERNHDGAYRGAGDQRRDDPRDSVQARAHRVTPERSGIRRDRLYRCDGHGRRRPALSPGRGCGPRCAGGSGCHSHATRREAVHRCDSQSDR